MVPPAGQRVALSSEVTQKHVVVQVGDKVVQCSASFGDDVWDAKNFGQVMFAIRTRNGGVFLKFKRMFGDVSQIEVRGHGPPAVSRGS